MEKFENVLSKVLAENFIGAIDLEDTEKLLTKFVGVPVKFEKIVYNTNRRSISDSVFKELKSKDLTNMFKLNIFSEIWVECDDSSNTKEGNTLLRFSYRWKHFGGGTNGTTIAVVELNPSGKVVGSRNELK